MPGRLAILLVLALAGATAGATAAAQEAGAALRVGTRVAPPFAMKAADGGWEGISIELWERVAAELGLRFEWQEASLAGLVDGVEAGRLDVAVADLAVTAEREARVDFSHPYFRGALGSAVAQRPWGGLEATAYALASREFLVTMGLLCTLLFVVGALTWLAERRRNAGEFEAEPRRGLLSGFWWAAVTTTTVGYGDKAPITLAGRLIATVWMFAALILTAVFTAQLAANITRHLAGSGFAGLDDITRARIGVVAGSPAGGVVAELGARPSAYAGIEAGFAALVDGRIDVFVDDAPVLIWAAAGSGEVAVTSLRFAPQDYAVALRPGSALREGVNRALLAVTAGPDWAAVERRYLGSAADGLGGADPGP